MSLSTADQADAIVIGSGPNGLVAATMLARAGWSVTVLEGNDVAGGAVASQAMTVPGYIHDPYSAFYGMLHASPVFTELGLDRRVDWATLRRADGRVPSRPDRASVCVSPTSIAPRKRSAASPPGDDAAWRELVQWWDKVGQHFLRMMLSPLGAIGPTLRVGRAVKVKRGLELAQIMLAPIATVAAQRFASVEAQALLCAGACHADVSTAAAGSRRAR